MAKTAKLHFITTAAALALFASVILMVSPTRLEAHASSRQEGEVTMTLLHNNDGESKLLADPESGFPGIARFTQTLQDLGLSSTSDILLRVTSGDNFLASKEFSASLAREGQPLYDSIALSGLYEAIGLGNHDFDFGPDVTARFIEGFSPPVTFLAANIDVSDEPALADLGESGRIAPSVVVKDKTTGIEVGVIGAITPRLPNISSPRGVSVSADVVGSVNAEAARLMGEGINRIVLVSHLQSLSEDRLIVPQLVGVDVVVAGGGDDLLKNDGDTCMPEEEAAASYPLVLEDLEGLEVPVVTVPGGYRCIGRLEVTFDSDGNVSAWAGSSIGVDLDGPAEDFAADNVEAPLAEALAAINSNVVGSSDVELDGRKPSVRTGPTNVGELLADALLAAGGRGAEYGGPVASVAIQNGGGIRNDAVIAPGDITEGDTFDIAPFSNFVVTTEVSRERFKELLEVAVRGLPEAEGYYPQIAGFSLVVDPSAPAREIDDAGDCSLSGNEGARVHSVVLDDGTPIIEDGAVIEGPGIALATIDFLANGGDCYPLADNDYTKVGLSYQQALASFISQDLAGSVEGARYPTLGSRVTFAESPDAAESGDEQAAEQAQTEDLPQTGSTPWPTVIAALTAAVGGAFVVREARKTALISVASRLKSTRIDQD